MLSKLKHFKNISCRFLLFIIVNIFSVCLNSSLQGAYQNDHVAIVVPLRNSRSHLQALLDRYVTFANKHKNNLTIIVVEGSDDQQYSRGEELNIGFLEAMKLNPSFVIFNDVSILPMQDDVWVEMMTCPKLNTCKNFHYFITHVDDIMNFVVGGVFSILPPDFVGMNGYPHAYAGKDNYGNVLAAHMQNACLDQLLYYDGDYSDEQRKFFDGEHDRSFEVREDFKRDGDVVSRDLGEEEKESQDGISTIKYRVIRLSKTVLSPDVRYYHIWFQLG